MFLPILGIVNFIFVAGSYYSLVLQQEAWFRFFHLQSLVFFSGKEFTETFLLYLFIIIPFLFLWCFLLKRISNFMLFLAILLFQLYLNALTADFLSFTLTDLSLPLYIPKFNKCWSNLFFIFFLYLSSFLLILLFPQILPPKFYRLLFGISFCILFFDSFSILIGGNYFLLIAYAEFKLLLAYFQRQYQTTKM